MLFLHLGACVLVLVLPTALWLQTLLLILLGLSLYRTLSQHTLRRASSAVCNVTLETDGDWRLQLNNAEERGPCCVRAHYVHPWLVLVQLRCPDARLPVGLVVAADAVDAESFRRLRARLTLEAGVE